jgi:hypothetical protein
LTAPPHFERHMAAYMFAAAGLAVGAVSTIVVVVRCWRDRAKTRTAV